MPLSKKGKKMLNVLIKEYGKRKGRDIFYAMEHSHPDWTKKWREDKNGKTNILRFKSKKKVYFE